MPGLSPYHITHFAGYRHVREDQVHVDEVGDVLGELAYGERRKRLYRHGQDVSFLEQKGAKARGKQSE